MNLDSRKIIVCWIYISEMTETFPIQLPSLELYKLHFEGFRWILTEKY